MLLFKNIKYITSILLFIPVLLIADIKGEVELFIRSQSNPELETRLSGCGFSHQLDLREQFAELEPAMQTMAREILQRGAPERQNSVVTTGGHFTIHYDLTGFNAVPAEDVSGNGIPDYIDSAMVILDHVWHVEIDQMGFNPPPGLENNPNGNYQVYFSKLSDYGITWLVDEIEDGQRKTFTSYLELNTDYERDFFYTKGIDAMRVTAAHEFHHAVQLGYNVWFDQLGNLTDRFFMEMTSTWMEDYVYDEINDYIQYLDFMFGNLAIYGFNSDAGFFPYANGLFLHMTADTYGPEMTRTIWDNIVQQPAMESIKEVLNERGENWPYVLNTYASWLYFTGERSVFGRYFKDAALFPMVAIKDQGPTFEERLIAYAMRHFRVGWGQQGLYRAEVKPLDPDGFINHVDGLETAGAAVSFTDQQLYTYTSTQPPVAIVTNGKSEQISEFKYSGMPEEPQVAPNPVVVETFKERIRFRNVPEQGKVLIYDIMGRKVKTLPGKTGFSVEWDMLNNKNQMVASGLYFYIITSGSINFNGKFVVVR